MVKDPESVRIWHDVVATYARSPAFEVKRMFGSEALLVDGRMACFVSGAGTLVAKLPAATAARLRADGLGEPMVMRGRAMKEWLSVRRDDDADWFSIVDEAVRYVRSLFTEEEPGRSPTP